MGASGWNAVAARGARGDLQRCVRLRSRPVRPLPRSCSPSPMDTPALSPLSCPPPPPHLNPLIPLVYQPASHPAPVSWFNPRTRPGIWGSPVPLSLPHPRSRPAGRCGGPSMHPIPSIGPLIRTPNPLFYQLAAPVSCTPPYSVASAPGFWVLAGWMDGLLQDVVVRFAVSFRLRCLTLPPPAGDAAASAAASAAVAQRAQWGVTPGHPRMGGKTKHVSPLMMITMMMMMITDEDPGPRTRTHPIP